MARTNYLGVIGLAALAAASTLGTVGCSGEDEDVACVSTELAFKQDLAPMLDANCGACHSPSGVASHTSYVLRPSAEAGYLDRNLEIVSQLAQLEQNGESLLLLKPTGRIPHEGGTVLDPDGAEIKEIENFISMVNNGNNCETTAADFFAAAHLMSPVELLRKSSLALAGRLPTQEEIDRVDEGGMPELDIVLDELMSEDVFYERLKETYNDRLLTDQYLFDGNALDLLGNDDDEEGNSGPFAYDPFWYESVNGEDAIKMYGAANGEDLQDKLRSRTIKAVAQETLELIAYVVRNNKPFGEVITAQYKLVNPYSAKAFGLDGMVEFENPADPSEWKPAEVGQEYYLAGVITNEVWNARHPTTPTNRNRHKVKEIYDYFLGTNILELAERPIDITNVQTALNPTMNDPNCNVCHGVIDPMAGALAVLHQNELSGDLEDDFVWYTDMSEPGFNGDKLPFADMDTGPQWVAQRIAQDERFALAATYQAFRMLMGRDPLAPNQLDPEDPDYDLKYKAYLGQYEVFTAIEKTFIENDQNFKIIVKELIKSPFFRAKNAAPGTSDDQIKVLGELGTAQFIIPEHLNRRLISMFNYHWTNGDGEYRLLDTNWYRILYGGTDSVDVTNRIRVPNGVMSNIADRLGNEVSCYAVPNDMALPKEQRVLFPYAEVTFEPMDANGFPVASAEEGIKQNIKHLHYYILGEVLEDGDPEIERTYQLFVQTWEEGKAGMDLSEGDDGYIESWLPGQCVPSYNYLTGEPLEGTETEEEAWENYANDDLYTQRAWMAVVSYLVTDYGFLYN